MRHHEVAYAGTLLLGGFAVVLMATLSSFFAGRGATLVILKVNVLVTDGEISPRWQHAVSEAGVRLVMTAPPPTAPTSQE